MIRLTWALVTLACNGAPEEYGVRYEVQAWWPGAPPTAVEVVEAPPYEFPWDVGPGEVFGARVIAIDAAGNRSEDCR